MKCALLALGLAALLVAGCGKKAADATADYPVNDSVVDISAPQGSHQQPVQPMNTQPVAYEDAMGTPQQASETGLVASGTYKVKKGDTFYSLARTAYGDGKQWTRIAQANPGITPEKLRVGQSINIP